MALKALNSVGGFSVGESPNVVIASNGDFSGNKANFVGNVAVLGILTDNYFFANGAPFDFEQPAGANTQVQFNSDDDFGASANFTFDTATNVLTVVGNVAAGNIKTNNLLYANGEPWELQEAAGANNQIQFNIGDDFAASANLTFDDSVQQFTVLGNAQFNNANLGNLLQANFAEITSNIIANNITSNLLLTANVANITGNATFGGAEVVIDNQLSGNTANFLGNIAPLGILTDNYFFANGAPFDFEQPAGANTQIQFNSDDDFGASANLTFDTATDTLTTVNANIITVNSSNLVGTGTDVTINANGFVTTFHGANGLVDISGPLTVDGVLTGVNANFTGNVSADTFVGNFSGNISGNITAPGANTQIAFNDEGLTNAVSAFTFDKASNVLTVAGNVDFENADLGNLAVANYINVANDLDVTGDLQGDTANFTGNVSVGNLSATDVSATTLGGSLTDASQPNITSVGTLSSLGVTGNVTAGNVYANSGTIGASLLTGTLTTTAQPNITSVGTLTSLSVTGNVSAGNLVGTLANGTSNVRIFNDANVELSVAGSANVVTVTDAGLRAVGNITSTAGNILANGNVTANGFLVSANANISGEAEVGSLVTDTITAPSGDLAINAAGSNSSINLFPTGTGTVDVNNFRITDLANPVDPLDATNKQYVDALAGEGLVIHTPVRVEAETELNATYAQGGTTPSVASIANTSEITFSAVHDLSVNDGIVFDNTFNGLTAGEAYWVAEVIDTTTITVKEDFTGAPVTTLTNGTGLTQASRANPGVGATLTNAGANEALVIDGVTVSDSDRVLVYEQSSGEQNGIYTVTTVGDGSTAWVLTRATDFNKYIPSSSLGVARNSYVLIQEGDTGAGEAYVMTDPTGEIIIGTDSLIFTQFSAASTFTGESGIDITGTIITANVDDVTTAIVSGNIVVKANAQLTTPNIGAATGTSLIVTGNVTSNNISISNIANISLDLTVGGNVAVDGTISSNANVSGLNLTTSGNVVASGNVDGNNVNATTLITAPTANVSGTVNAGNVSITNDLQGNTATFSGNIVVPNIAVNLALSGNTATFSGNVLVPNLEVNLAINGNTASFTGNIDALNADLGNLAVANFFTGTLIDGTSNLVITENGNITLTAQGNSSFVVTDTGANVVGNLGISGDLSASSVTANTLTANTNVEVGDTNISWGTLTTSAITANQTIAEFAVTGVTGAEFIVKGEDSTGTKYSVATVAAVTDGTNVDFVTYATATLGGFTGSLAVNKVGSNIALQVTPASSNSTVWTAQFRTI